MTAPRQAPSTRCFGAYEIDLHSGELRKNGMRLRLSGQPFQVLAILIERAGELVTRDELRSRLWAADTFVDFDHGLNNAVARIREVLDDSSGAPRYVETLPRRGYRFIASVDRIAADTSSASAAAPAATDVPTPHTPTRRIAIVVPIAIAALVIAAIALVVRQSFTTRAHPVPLIRSVAVLPLNNLSGDPSQEYLADGLTEELIGRLASIHDLRVISRTSVMRFKNTQLGIPAIAQTLGVDAIVEGSVMREGSHIRVHAQLIRAATDEHFWSETYDRELRDVFDLETEVAESVAAKVEVLVTGRERARLASNHPVSPEAYESYLRGEFALHKNTHPDLQESIRYFEQATRQDPAFAPAYIGLAAAYDRIALVLVGAPPDQTRPKVIAAARKALELDPDNAEAHVLLATEYQKSWKWSDAEEEYNKALALNANDAGAQLGYAKWLLCKGRIDEAINRANHARRLDPLAVSGVDVGWILFLSRRYDLATRELRAYLAVNPDDAMALWYLGFVLIAQGDPQNAIPVLEKAVPLSRGSPGIRGVLVRAYAAAGRRQDALLLLNELRNAARTGYVPAGAFAQAYMGFGDKDQELAWLEKAYAEQSNLLQWIKVEPTFDALRNDPRFIDLVNRVGL